MDLHERFARKHMPSEPWRFAHPVRFFLLSALVASPAAIAGLSVVVAPFYDARTLAMLAFAFLWVYVFHELIRDPRPNEPSFPGELGELADHALYASAVLYKMGPVRKRRLARYVIREARRALRTYEGEELPEDSSRARYVRKLSDVLMHLNKLAEPDYPEAPKDDIVEQALALPPQRPGPFD